MCDTALSSLPLCMHVAVRFTPLLTGMAHAQAVFDELCDVLNPQKKPYVPKKGKPNVIMFVGLQVQQDEAAT